MTKYTILCLTLLIVSSLNAQNSFLNLNSFSQQYSPSYAGIHKGHNFATNYRNKYPSISVNTIFVAGYDTFIESMKSGIGVYYYKNSILSNAYTFNNFSLNYNYEITIAENYHIRPALSVNFTRERLDFNKLTFSDQINPDGTVTPVSSEIAPLSAINNFNFDASLLFYSNALWIGTTVKNMLPQLSTWYLNDTYNNRNVTAFAGYNHAFDNGSANTAMVYFAQYTVNQFTDLAVARIYLQNNWFDIGFGSKFRVKNTPANVSNFVSMEFMIGFRVKNISLAYSYESGLKPNLNTTELKLSYTIK